VTRPEILFAHERSAVARAVERVLHLHGMSTVFARTGTDALAALQRRRFDALVVDVALPDEPGYEIGRVAKELAAHGDGAGAPFTILVASVYRRTSYKRRPARLYGADDYVEIHHLGDMLPSKLRGLLRLPDAGLTPHKRAALEDEAHHALLAEGDSRMTEQDRDSLAALIVADVVLYNGDRIVGAGDLAAAEAAVADDLAIARDLMDQVARAGGGSAKQPDPIGRAFRSLMRAMGRVEVTP
jgi:DNA-binding response OmpR family regulator